MADNIDVTPGTGKTVAADEIAGALHQRVKITVGADGTNDGDVSSANPLPVNDAGGSLTVDNAHLTSLGGAVSGTEVQVDIVASLPEGTNAIGKLSENSGVDIGDVDVTSCALPTGASTAAKQDTIIGHVDGIETVLGTIDGDTSDLAGCVAGTEVQVDVVAPLPAGTNAIGKLAANSGVDIGDVDVLSLPSLPAGTNNIGDVDVLSLPALAAGTNSIGQVQPTKFPTTDDAEYMKKYYTSAGAATDGIIWSPAAGKRWYVTDLIVNVSAAATVTLEDDLTAGDSPILKCELAANGGFCKRFATPLASGEDGADLTITTTAGNVYVTAVGYEV